MAGVDGRLDQMLVAAEILGNGQLPFGVVRETLLNGGKLLGRLVCLAKRIECHSKLHQTVGGQPLGTGQGRFGRCPKIVYPVFRSAFAAL